MLIPGAGDTTADAVGKAVRAYDTTIPLRFLRHLTDDVYHRGDSPGGCLIVIPGIWTGMPPELLAAVRQRRTASTTGRCPACQVCVEPVTGTFRHEPACLVADEILGQAIATWRHQVGRYARGRRIREEPS